MIDKSFIVTISEFLSMQKQGQDYFDQNRPRYVIPKYQREYKWDIERVVALFNDINNRDKFIGNIILNRVNDYYEIVDGQQRITTILLFLVALFNRSKPTTGDQKTEEQITLLRYIKHNGHIVLENESIGEYLEEDRNEIKLNIAENCDVYFQNQKFSDVYNVAYERIDPTTIDILSFQRKVLDCQIMVLVGETGGRQHDSIEEVFLDINFKSQLLDVADIFKGYCFRNYDSTNHEELKAQWTEIRKSAKRFETFGYKDTSQYLYHYLLSRPGSYAITEDLTPQGVHYLERKNNTETKAILLEMSKYGENVIRFCNNLPNDTYFFEDICSDARNHRAEIVNNRLLRKMISKIVNYREAQYHKFPLFMFIHYLQKTDALKNCLVFDDLKKITTNYYAYAFFFVNDSHSKSKGSIDHSIFEALYDEQKTPTEKIRNIVVAVKLLRSNMLNSFQLFKTFSQEKAYALYTLMDRYVAANNFITDMYSLPEYNQEHLIIHDNRDANVTWIDNTNFTFSLKSLLGGTGGTVNLVTRLKRQMSNYLILPETLNTDLGINDIISKIAIIEDYYQRLGLNIPNHVATCITHIRAIDKFQQLYALKGRNASETEIKEKYKEFIEAYFDETAQDALYNSLKASLRTAFQNN